MLSKYNFGHKTFNFTVESIRVETQNVFTIIVGKNGSGKSRLLNALVSETLGMKAGVRSFDTLTIQPNIRRKNDRISYISHPVKVIAASTSPFDKFPLIKRNTKSEHYSYLGLRDLQSHNFGLSYLSKIIFELLSSVFSNPNQISEIGNVLKYLGYADRISLKLEIKIQKLFQNNFKLVNEDEKNFIIEQSEQIPLNLLNKKFFFDEEGKLIASRIKQLSEIINRTNFDQRRRHVDIELSGTNVLVSPHFPGSIEDLLFLFEAGFIILKEVNLQEIESEKVFSISDASSGQQCVVIGILGIASQICDNSLICIDEPEICLHPEWQERYIRILINTFRNYRNCHFIIATHSPQIISNLESDNCYILSMEDRDVISAAKVNNHSIDFQLAKVFHTPGFKNEYLTRIALNTFAKVSTYKVFDREDKENLKQLKTVQELLDTNDPLSALIFSLLKLKELYA